MSAQPGFCMLLVSLQAGELCGQLPRFLLKRIGCSNILLQEPDLQEETLLLTTVFFLHVRCLD